VGTNSAIEWTDATWNPWQGCTKVSEACAHCYMFRDMARYGRDGSIVVRSKPPTFNLPLSKTREGRHAIASGSKVFTCSWSDWFHVNADAWRADAWEIIRQRPDVTFQIVTKRTERIAKCLPPDWGRGWPNVWLIATVENHERFLERLQPLLDVPAPVRGLSCEPLLGPLDIRFWLKRPYQIDNAVHPSLDWVIVGGESGPGARPMDLAWARAIVEQCKTAAVACFVKQLGAKPFTPNAAIAAPLRRERGRDGNFWLTLRNKKGGDPSEWPADLRVRDFPIADRSTGNYPTTGDVSEIP